MTCIVGITSAFVNYLNRLTTARIALRNSKMAVWQQQDGNRHLTNALKQFCQSSVPLISRWKCIKHCFTA